MKKTIATLLALMMILAVLPTGIFAASTTVTSKLDMAELNSHGKGNGYTWDNNDLIFEMTDLDLSTTDDLGLLLPGGSTVVLNGDNTITASRYGIHCYGSLTFMGDGTLTINVNDIGIRSVGSLDRENLIFRSGTVVINGTNTGIISDNANVVFSGASVTVNSKINSIFAKNVQFVGGTIALSAPVKARGSAEINAVNLTVSAAAPAIVADKGIKIDKVAIEAGATPDALGKAENYNGENCVKFTSTVKVTKKGMLFGGKLPAFVDYIVFTLIILAVAAVIAVPIIIKKRKTDKLIAISKLSDKK